MLVITKGCDWCETLTDTTTVIVKGFEKFTHDVCENCVDATELVKCAYCDNNASFMVDTFYFNPRYFGICESCGEW